MKHYIIGLIMMVSPMLVFAHNPLSAKYHLDAGEKVSLLTINLSQDGVNQVLLNTYSESELTAMTKNEFKALIVNYIKNNFSLTFDKRNIELKEGGVKLGSHQTDLKFVLPPISSDTEKIAIHIPAFQENENHQTIFSYRTNSVSDYKILSVKNNYQTDILLLAPTKSTNWKWISMVILMTFLFLVLIRYSVRNAQHELYISANESISSAV